jgi:hypothetical protein
MNRKHLKSFQEEHYKKAGERIERCGERAVLAFCGIWTDGDRDFKRYKLI